MKLIALHPANAEPVVVENVENFRPYGEACFEFRVAGDPQVYRMDAFTLIRITDYETTHPAVPAGAVAGVAK